MRNIAACAVSSLCALVELLVVKLYGNLWPKYHQTTQ